MAFRSPRLSLVPATLNRKYSMMREMMMNSGMMWGMGVIWVLVVVILVLAIAALVKYVFFR
jgi:hypothetical protein